MKLYKLFFVLIVMLLSAYSFAQDRSQNIRTDRTYNQQHPYTLLLVPMSFSGKDISLKDECWAKLYDGENYNGDSITLVGPIEIANVDKQTPFGANWENKVSSLQVGSRATLTVYDNDNFKDQVGQFKSGARINDVSRRMGFFDEFASLKLSCN